MGNTIEEAYDKIIKVTDSCQTPEHFECAWKMGKQFKILFIDAIPKSKKLSGIDGLPLYLKLRSHILIKLTLAIKNELKKL